MSGRWFAAPGFNGPWTFATTSLPPDFARIPADGPRGFVLVSVPGTPQAQEALIEAQIPQQGTLSRDAAKLDVVYAGEPQFAPIPGTPMSYAVNTSFNVIQTGEGYFSCYQGAWFAAPAPAGPWALAASVPPVVYTIPPASPMYPCTYVRVYAATPQTVTYGYTSGYTMSYVSAGVVVYGTGYYYPPYIYPAPIPIYYPYPYSYAGATYYNATTGAWAQGGAIYGPYGGAAKAGYALQPEHRRVRAGRRDLRPERRRRRVLRLQPEHRQLRARQRGMGSRRRVGQRELVQREHRALGLDAAEQQCVRALGLEHDHPAEPDGPHAKPEQRAGQRRLVLVDERRQGRGRFGGRRQQRRRRQDRGRRRVRGRRRQRVQEDRQRLAEVRQRLVELGRQAGDAAHGSAIGRRPPPPRSARRAHPGRQSVAAQRRNAGRPIDSAGADYAGRLALAGIHAARQTARRG